MNKKNSDRKQLRDLLHLRSLWFIYSVKITTMKISTLFKGGHILHLSKDSFIHSNLIQSFLDQDYIIVRLDWNSLANDKLLIKSIYKQINAPDNFSINWNALWDTLTDREFWFKKPSVIIIENSKRLLSDEKETEEVIFKEILEDLPQDELPFLVIYVDN